MALCKSTSNVLDGLSLSRPVLVRDWICYQAMEQSKAKQSKTSPVRIGSVMNHELVMMVSMMSRIVGCGCIPLGSEFVS